MNSGSHEGAAASRRRRFSVRTIFGVIIAGSVVLAGCDDKAEQKNAGQAPPPSVTVATAFGKDVRASAEFVGKVEAIDSVDLIARVVGFLREKKIEDGASVNQGDLLFQIEEDQYETSVAAAEADLARAKADLKLKNADLERDEQLLKKGHLAKAKFEAGEAARDQAKAAVGAAEASVRQAKLQLDYTDIHAQFDGRIGRTAYSVGDVVGPSGKPLARLVRVAPVYVAFSVSEKDLIQAIERSGGSLRQLLTRADAPKLSVVLPTGQRLEESGAVVFVDNQVDPRTGTIGVRGQFANGSELLIPGQFVTVILEAAKAERRLMVPQAALQRDQKGDFVLVINAKQMVEQRHIKTGDQVETAWTVEDGLQEGERVIVQGLQKVRPGVPVNAILEGKPVE